ncbi:MAG: ABC transporter ATP-binding protein, partial [Candidatus Diapherotrites archaeon]|nr:ABC transporter ATP-binding protein [Candidatus Diapherotrites archaeon]
MVKEEKNEVNFKEVLGAYWFIVKPYWRLLVLVTVCMFFVSISSVGEKYIFKLFLDGGANFSSNVLSKDNFISLIYLLAGSFVFIITTKAIFGWLRFHFINRFEVEVIFDLKKKFFMHVLRLSHKFHSTHRVGSLISRLTRGASAIESLSDFFLFNCLPLGMQFTVVAISLIYLDFLMVLVIIIVMAAFLIFVTVIMKKQQIARVELNNKEDEEKAVISDVFGNFDAIKYFGKEARIGEVYSSIVRTVSDLNFKSWGYERWTEAGQAIIVGGG